MLLVFVPGLVAGISAGQAVRQQPLGLRLLAIAGASPAASGAGLGVLGLITRSRGG
jgi:hypothetical protein